MVTIILHGPHCGSEALVAPDPEDPTSTMLELDERMARLSSKQRMTLGFGSPCGERAEKLVAYAMGKRSKQTCQRLWEAMPQEYRQGHCFTDFLNIYVSVMPEEHHSAVGPRDGRDRSCGALE